MFVPNSLPVKSVSEFIAYGGKRPFYLIPSHFLARRVDPGAETSRAELEGHYCG
jgi:hypothetical protein